MANALMRELGEAWGPALSLTAFQMRAFEYNISAEPPRVPAARYVVFGLRDAIGADVIRWSQGVFWEAALPWDLPSLAVKPANLAGLFAITDVHQRQCARLLKVQMTRRPFRTRSSKRVPETPE